MTLPSKKGYPARRISLLARSTLCFPSYVNDSSNFVRKRGLRKYCWFSHDVTKIQTTKLSILGIQLRFYFHGVLEQLKTNFQTNFRFRRVLAFVIEYA